MNVESTPGKGGKSGEGGRGGGERKVGKWKGEFLNLRNSQKFWIMAF